MKRAVAAFKVRQAGRIAHWGLVAAGAVALGLGVSMPILVVDAVSWFSEPRSLIGTVVALTQRHEWLLAAVIGFFSLVFPVLKLILAASGARVVGSPWFAALAKWSVLDLYVVACLVAAIQFGWLSSARIGPGVLWFSAGLVLTAVAAGRHGATTNSRITPLPRAVAVGSAIALLAGWLVPVLIVKKFWVASSEVSLLGATLRLLAGSPWGWILAVGLLLGGLLAPLARCLALPSSPPWLVRLASWQMLDVLAGAVAVLGIKLFAGGSGSIGWGAPLVFAALTGIYWPRLFRADQAPS